jgi:hypothetical protein
MRTITWLAVLLLAGCAGGGDQMAHQDDLADALADAPADTPAGEPFTHHDGLTVAVTGLEPVQARDVAELAAGHTPVKVTVELDNGSGDAVPLESPFQPVALLTGPNRAEASRVSGWMDGPELATDLPRQVGAGQTLEVFYTFEVPRDQLDELAVEVSFEPDRYPPVLFVGAEDLLS